MEPFMAPCCCHARSKLLSFHRFVHHQRRSPFRALTCFVAGAPVSCSETRWHAISPFEGIFFRCLWVAAVRFDDYKAALHHVITSLHCIYMSICPFIHSCVCASLEKSHHFLSTLLFMYAMSCHPVQYKLNNGVNAMYFAFLWSYRLACDLPVTGCRIKAVLARATWQVSTTAGCFLSAVPHAETSLILWASLSFCLSLAF
jgi:hypothetical protein